MRPFFIYFSLFVTVFLGSLSAKAQSEEPSCAPTVLYHDADTVEWKEATTSISGSAPISVQFSANPKNTTGWTEHYEWRFTRQGESEPFMIRYEENTDYEFSESNPITVVFYYQFSKDGDLVTDSTNKWTITAYESKLVFPNAFSPNGDEFNEVYKAKDGYRSIIEFHGYIFNRWGKKLFEWTNPADGWDGKFNGKDVKEGVYYALIKAKGADGRKFVIKKDVNLIRGFNEDTQSSSSSSQ